MSPIRIFFLFSIVLTMIFNSIGYTYVDPFAKSEDKEGFCYHKEHNVLIKIDQKKYLPNCEIAECHKDYSMTVFG
jgi:hypothetical protein